MSGNSSRIVDLPFTGAAVVPSALTLAGRFDLAFTILRPVLITACLTSAHLDGSPTDQP